MIVIVAQLCPDDEFEVVHPEQIGLIAARAKYNDEGKLSYCATYLCSERHDAAEVLLNIHKRIRTEDNFVDEWFMKTFATAIRLLEIADLTPGWSRVMEGRCENTLLFMQDFPNSKME